MVVWVRDNELLWHPKREGNQNKPKKDGMWRDKAAELGYSEEHLKGWWSHMRDTYTRLHSHKGGRSSKKSRIPAVFTDRQVWIDTNLHFLQDVVRHRGDPGRPVSTSIRNR